MLIWSTFEYHWDLLLRGCATRRQKDTQIHQFKETHTVQQRNYQL